MNKSTALYTAINSYFEQALESGLKYPKIRLETTSRFVIVLSKAGGKSAFKDSISICSLGAYGENTFYGRLQTNGGFNWNSFETDKLLAVDIQLAMEKFIDDPIASAKFYAAQTGNCCFCNTAITTDESLTAGYGPVCAENYGLPWGATSDASQIEIDLPDLSPADSEHTDVTTATTATTDYGNELDAIDNILIAWKVNQIPTLAAFTQIEDIIRGNS